LTTLEQIQERAEADARTYGYYLVKDPEFFEGLTEGLKKNEERYGYFSCPCRLASGKLEYDRDILCPCDYRDPDVMEFGACYCNLYVRKDIYEGKMELQPVPERRPIEKQARAYSESTFPGALGSKVAETETRNATSTKASTLSKEQKEEMIQIAPKMWYCKQCGYVVFREDPPYICPICKAKRELFAEIKTTVAFSG
jgi:ferredoxin-thioredoxin reductase catalytic chain